MLSKVDEKKDNNPFIFYIVAIIRAAIQMTWNASWNKSNMAFIDITGKDGWAYNAMGSITFHVG